MKRGARRAQAMVEFALALPIFLLVVYGLMEVGRLIFMEATVVTASREAVRYASAWGVNSSNTQQYLDCTGIRDAAKNVGFLLGLSDSNIQIGWDPGTSTTVTSYCAVGTGTQTGLTLTAGQRVVVTVTATYQPILPFFLPLTTKNMTSTARRTVMGIINLNTPTP